VLGKTIRLIFVFSIVVSSIQNAIADNYVDSLKKALHQHTSDTSKVLTYVNLGYYYDGIHQVDTALFFYEKAIALSKKAGDKKFQGMAYYYTGLLYQNKGDYRSAISNFTLALTAYREIKRWSRIGATFNSIGVTYYYNGQFDSAIANYARAIPVFEQVKDIFGIANCYNNLGIMYDVKGDRVKAIESYLKAIKIYEDAKRDDLKCGPYQNIALINITQKQYDEALKNLDIARKIAIEYKDDESLIRILNAIGSCYDYTNRSDEANTYFKDAMQLAEKIKNESLMAISLTNLGENYLFLDRIAEAEKTLMKCVEVKTRLGNPVSLGVSEIALAQAFYKGKKFSKAIDYYKRGMLKVKEAGYKEYQKIALEGLASSYAQSGNFKNAYYNLDVFVKINDTLLNESNKRIVAELQTKYETDKKEAEIKLLSKDKALQDEALKRKRTEFNMVVGVSCVGLVLLIYVVVSLRNKRKANSLLEEKNIEIMRQRDEIQLQKDMVDEKQKEILDSILYAKRIQQSLLPTDKYIERNIKKS
jgi:tetratricopeptide (TPR) repeat protein